MAEESNGGGAGGIIEGLENLLINYWLHIVVLILTYFTWEYRLFKEIFSFIGVFFLGWVTWKLWVHYIQQDFISGIEWVLLEIVPPREVLRSPLAMELFLTNALYHWSMKGGYEEYFQGAVWFWFSLEIVSIEGQVHFYIRTPSRIKSLIETQMYAQYPQAQVKVVEDYTLAVDEITPTSAWNAWGCEFKLVKHEAFPVKTYVDYGLHEDPKEELKIDPISPVIELFSSMEKGEQMWMQVVITPSKKMWHTEGTWRGKHDWVEESRVQIKKVLDPYARQHPRRFEEGLTMEYRTPDFLKNQTKGMNDKTGKLGFETGIRVMYVAKKEAFKMNSRRNLRLAFRQYAKPDSNEFYRINSTQGDALGSSILSLSPKQVMILANRTLNDFRERNFFHNTLREHLFNEHAFHRYMPIPLLDTLFMFVVKKFFLLPYFHQITYVLNTEEIATLWHFPGQILKVPTLERIESKEASPPPNLPV